MRWQIAILAASCGILLGAVVLQARPDQRVSVRGWPGAPLPHVCVSRTWLGVDCPSCGLTRSFILLAHGDWRASARAHRLGWVLAGLVALQVPYRIWLLAGRKRPLLSPRASLFLMYGLVALLIANWLAKCFVG